jgi:hypothetical protein
MMMPGDFTDALTKSKKSAPPQMVDVGVRQQLIRLQLMAMMNAGHEVLPEWLTAEGLAGDVFQDMKTNMQLVKMAAQAGVQGSGDPEDEKTRIIRP